MIYSDNNTGDLLSLHLFPERGYLPRQTIYGSAEAQRIGLVSAMDYPDMLPDQKDWKEIIRDCHARQVFPMYHRKAAGLPSKSNQARFNHCWAYGVTNMVEDCEASEGDRPAVKLSPSSLAWLVNYRNVGYFMDRTIEAVGTRGIAPIEYCPEYEMNPRNFKPDWEKIALEHVLKSWWDIHTGISTIKTIAQCLAVLSAGKPLYSGLNWWGHALGIEGMTWDDTQPNGIVWDYFNSHNDGHIQLAGSRGVPSEAYGPRATVAA